MYSRQALATNRGGKKISGNFNKAFGSSLPIYLVKSQQSLGEINTSIPWHFNSIRTQHFFPPEDTYQKVGKASMDSRRNEKK